MLLYEFKDEFFDSLKEEYPRQEVNSFFWLLTENFLGMTRLQVALERGRRLSAPELERLEEALKRLGQHEPVQYILGKTEFYGMPFHVNEHVLIPRPETEELVAWILHDVKDKKAENLKLLDIGTGSGCIAVSLARHLPGAEVTAIDISEETLKVAHSNAERNGVRVRLVQQDILTTASLDSRYDLIVSNPPYVRQLEKKEMHRNVLEHEPAGALYVEDTEPLIFYDKIAALAVDSLLPDGVLYFEINQYLGRETAALLTKNNFSSSLKKDIFGNDRMLKGKLNSNR